MKNNVVRLDDYRPKEREVLSHEKNEYSDRMIMIMLMGATATFVMLCALIVSYVT